MVRHHDERVQEISLKTILTVLQRRSRHLGNLRLPQKHWARASAVQQPVHRNERVARSQSVCRKDTVRGKTSSQPKRNKQRWPDYVSMRKAALVLSHLSMVAEKAQDSHLEVDWCLHVLWGRQSCLQPGFRPAGPAGKRVRSLKRLPHDFCRVSDVAKLSGIRLSTCRPAFQPARLTR